MNNVCDDPKGSIPGVGALAPFILFFIFYFVSLSNAEVNTENDFIILHQLYGQKKLVVDFDFRKAGIEPDIIAEVDFELYSSEEQRIIDRKEIKPVTYHRLNYRQFRGIFDMQKLSSGVYKVNTIVKDNNGNDLKNSVKEFSWLPKELEKFKWINSKEGITDEVLAPWIPIEVEKKDKGLIVKVWGRKYHFKKNIFPDRIETKGKDILAGPIQVKVKVDGKNVSLQWNKFQIEKQTPSIVCFKQEAKGDGLILSGKTQIEYDGMIRIDWKVTSEKSLKLEELIFEIPILTKYAKYIYTPGHTGKVGFLQNKKLVTEFTPTIWLGDEELGLQWFCESQKDWYNIKSSRCIEILPEDDKVTLSLRLIDKEIHMEHGIREDYGLNIPVMQAPENVVELNYTFGFHATPIKPVIKDVWDYRIHHVGHVKSTTGTGERFTSLLKPGGDYNLDDFAKAGVKTIAFHAHWTDFYGATSTPYVEDLKKLVEECHKRGIQLLLYLGFMMSELDPAWSLFSEECLKLAPTPNEWDWTKRDTSPMPKQKFYDTCWRSVWQNYYADGVKQMMTEYGIDGVYLDSTSLVFGGCSNTLHGCGFIAPDGKIRNTYQLFDNRQMMQRIYTLVKKYNPDGQVNLHNSTELFAPTMSWATSYWDGEHLGYSLMIRGLSTNSPILEQMPLDYFRAEFMGVQWGVAAEFLYGYIFPNATVTIGVSLLHDVPARGLSNALCKLFGEFGRKESEWLPYWKNKDYVSIKPEGGVRLSSAEVKDVYVSLYKHPKNGVLAVVVNLSEVETNVKVQLNKEKLGLKKDLYAFNTVHDGLLIEEPVKIIDSSTFELKLSSGVWKVIWVKE